MHAAHGTGPGSLTPEEVAGYLAGRGMGLARPAELNHHPGPRHVLDLAKELSLTDRQASATQAIYERMLASALPLGAKYVEAEQRLAAAFQRGGVEGPALSALVQEAARLRGELRFVHLAAHAELRPVLTSDQVARYDALRGQVR
ncbi:MAG TPA: Spy/CpxP family protein refolding chaperone [Vicinamibacteria bacterium]|nr:Spy/CpxP family protein refolding chaperone [Vicinamibacteria bacterium]